MGVPQYFALAALIACLGVPGARAAASPQPTAVAAEIRRANDALEANARAHDLDKLVREFYSEQPIVAFGGPRLVNGVAEAKAFWKELLEHGTITLASERIEASGDLASEVGKWTLRVEAEEGDSREEVGVYYVTWRRIDGRWKAVIHAFFPGGFREVD